MLVQGFENQEGNLELVKQLLEDKGKQVYGVFYTNSFLSQRYLCRSHTLVKEIDIAEDTLKLLISTRVEHIGLMEMENTLDMLARHEAGDIPGFLPEGLLDTGAVDPVIPEVVSVTQYLTSLDLFLILKDSKVSYQTIHIAGKEFTLVNLQGTLGEEEEDKFEQVITLLFGEAGKMYLLSNFFNTDLSAKDAEIILDLIVDENITGKAITAIKIETTSGVSSMVLPYNALISSYTAANGEIVFGDGSGYIRIPKEKLEGFKLTCIPSTKGSYTLQLKGAQETISIYME